MQINQTSPEPLPVLLLGSIISVVIQPARYLNAGRVFSGFIYDRCLDKELFFAQILETWGFVLVSLRRRGFVLVVLSQVAVM